MGVVYVKNDCVVAWSQGQSPLSLGDVWDDQAPLVIERPDLFDVEPTRVRGRQAVTEAAAEPEQEAPAAPPVETTTAQPGTKRTTTARTTKRR